VLLFNNRVQFLVNKEKIITEKKKGTPSHGLKVQIANVCDGPRIMALPSVARKCNYRQNICVMTKTLSKFQSTDILDFYCVVISTLADKERSPKHDLVSW